MFTIQQLFWHGILAVTTMKVVYQPFPEQTS